MFAHLNQHHTQHICGLYYNVPFPGHLYKKYLPQVDVRVHASILATTSRTRLQQTFQNPSTSRAIRQVRYAFPLYDGVSVVGFQCRVGNRLITGEVKPKETAKRVYQDAVNRGETAGLLEQLPEASDVFTTTIGNIPPGAKVTVDITYLGELKHDMEVDGIRFTIPTSICPRYGNTSSSASQHNGTIAITVDAAMAEGSFIQRLQSPSHPISMSMGTTSVDPDATPCMSKASATLTLGVAHLDTDFILQVIAKDTGIPKAILETHPTIPNQRALMATLVPKFALPPERPEIVFVCDQSGSMAGSSMALAKEALQVFLKSLPLGVKFNICSFGSHYSFLFTRSASYNQDTLETATRHAAGLSPNYGGTEMLPPLQATIQNRYKDMPLDIILLTDGEIWEQQQLFDYLNGQIQDTKAPIRVFTLGIGSGVSHSLIEGVAKAGNGFAQSVQEGEKMNTKVVRMLKGALSPHVNDYTLEVKYSAASEDDFEVVERVADSLKVALDLNQDRPVPSDPPKKISLFDSSLNESTTSVLPTPSQASQDPFSHLSAIPAPKILQAPQSIPSLFAFHRTTIYLLLSPSAPQAVPSSVVLRGTSAHGPLELEIPVHVLPDKGETIHQLAAKKAVSELEQGRGWLACAQTAGGELLKEKFEGRFADMLEREAARLGTLFQVAGKWASFVATETTARTGDGHARGENNSPPAERDWEYLEDFEAAAPERERVKMQFGQGLAMQQSLFRSGNGGGMRGGAQLFGAAAQSAASASASPFSSSPFAQNAPPSGGLFGYSSAQNAAPSGSLFGGASQNIPSTGGLFGAQASTGGLFGGAATSSQPPTGGLFGSPSSAQNTPSTGGLFGAAPVSSQAPAGNPFGGFSASSQNSGSSLFGAASAQNHSSTGGLFGAASASSPTPTGNPFGGFPASSQPSGSSLFGSTSSAQNAPATSSLFGASSAQNNHSTGGLFGAPSVSSQPSASSLFGAPSAQNTFSAGGLFGGVQTLSAHNAPPTGSLFGAPPASSHAPAAGLFRSPQANQVSSNSNANPLQDYQMGLMVLNQDNKKRLHMFPAAAAPASSFTAAAPVPPPPFHNTERAPAPASHTNTTPLLPPSSSTDSQLENFDFDSFLHTDPSSGFTHPANFDFSSTATHSSAPVPASPQDLLRLLIAHQSFTGAFPHSAHVLAWLGVAAPDFEQALRSIRAQNADTDQDTEMDVNTAQDTAKRETLLTTALVVVYMEQRLAALKGEFELVAEKARTWLEGECAGDRGEAYWKSARWLL